jgi:hypothetical protein
MNMHSSQQQLIRDLPDVSIGYHKNDYIREAVAWAVGEGYPQMQAVEAARIKWQSWEVGYLILDILDGDAQALRDGVVMLLKDRYIV